MRMSTQWLLILALVCGLSMATVSPVFAIYRQLSTTLTGPAIGGVTPQGEAKVNQANYPAVPPSLQVKVKNVNLPDGTPLQVYINTHLVGSFTLNAKQSEMTTNLPFTLGASDNLFIKNGATVVLSTTNRWKT